MDFLHDSLMANHDWLGELTKKQDALRVHHGLVPMKDGWYKWVDGKKRYIARRMPLAEVAALLPTRLQEIAGAIVEREARINTASTTILALSEMFMAHLWQRHQTGTPRTLSRRTYDDYADVLARFCKAVGPSSPAASIDTTWFSRFMRTIATRAATTQRREIIYLTAFMNWAGPGRHSLGFFKTPVQFGPDFRKPDEIALRQGRSRYTTLYTPESFAEALDAVACSPMLYALGLMALNGAYLPDDLTTLPLSAIDLETGVVEFERHKTGVDRKTVLMPETIAAVRRYLEIRPVANPPVDVLFVRDDGLPFSRRKPVGPEKRSNPSHALGQYWHAATGKPLKGLRTSFATYGDGLGDQEAVNLVMGHASKSVRSKFYVKQFQPERLLQVVRHVWGQVAPTGPLPSVAWISASGLVRRTGRQRAYLTRRLKRTRRSDTAAA
jgi:integrase